MHFMTFVLITDLQCKYTQIQRITKKYYVNITRLGDQWSQVRILSSRLLKMKDLHE